MRPRFSIITPSLNQGPYVQAALASVGDSAARRVNIWCMIRAHSIYARRVLAEFGAGAPHVRVFLEPDEGPAEAINKGFAAARGTLSAGSIAMISTRPKMRSRSWALRSMRTPKRRSCMRAAPGPCARRDGRACAISRRSRRHGEALNRGEAFIQPAAFVRRGAWSVWGCSRRAHRLVYDFEFSCAAASGRAFSALDAEVARKRRHGQAASPDGRGPRHGMRARYAPASWAREFRVDRVRGGGRRGKRPRRGRSAGAFVRRDRAAA